MLNFNFSEVRVKRMSLNLAERVLYHDGLSQDECLKIYEDPNIDTFELLNEAYIVRKHYYGKK